MARSVLVYRDIRGRTGLLGGIFRLELMAGPTANRQELLENLTSTVSSRLGIERWETVLGLHVESPTIHQCVPSH
jgi:hypothetical protein